MALKATLHINGYPSTFNIVECEYNITQAVNLDGVPCAGVAVGKIIVTIVSPEKAYFLQKWMLDDFKQCDGYIEMDVNYNRLSRNASRIIEFKDAFCIGLYEYFNNQNSDMTTMRLTIYASYIQFADSRNAVGVGYDNRSKKPSGV